jgi:hypothetical protein
VEFGVLLSEGRRDVAWVSMGFAEARDREEFESNVSD